MANLKSAYEDIRDAQRSLAARRKFLSDNRKMVNALLRRLAPAEKAGKTAWVAVSAYSGSIIINASMYNLLGFKDQGLCDVLERFCDADKMETKDWPSNMNRDYRFVYPVFVGSITVVISAYVQESSPTCKKVLKETRTSVVNTDVYELVCD